MVGRAPGPRELVWSHLARHVGEPKTAFIDANGWSAESSEPGPPIDVICIPPAGDRRFLYLCTFGSCLHPLGQRRVEFVTAIAQSADETANRARLELAVRHLRSWAKRAHVQALPVERGGLALSPSDARPVMIGEAGVAFLEPRIGAKGLSGLVIYPRSAIGFMAAVPVHATEIDFGVRMGASALAGRLEQAGVTEMIDPERAPACETARATAAA